jgi:prefoldin subunit 5
MSDEIQRTLGEHDAQIGSLERDMRELRADVKEILATLNATKGGWKTLVMISGAAGAAGAFIGKILPFWK